MADKQSLPDSRDASYWAGDKIKINKHSLKNQICDEHNFELVVGERRAECKDCGYGFIFKVSEVEEREGELLFKGADLQTGIKIKT